MKGARLLVLLLTLWSRGGMGLNHTWATPQDKNAWENRTSALVAVENAPNHQMLPAAHTTLPENATALEVRTPEDHLQKSASLPSEMGNHPEAVRNQTLPASEKMPEQGGFRLATLAPLGASTTKSSPGAGSADLSDSTLRFLQSFAKKPDPQAASQTPVGNTGNRSPRQTYLSRGDNSRGQNTDSQQSSFETTKGKNWCAHVHTRLSPTMILDHQPTYISSGRGACGWPKGSCPQRPQNASSPVYRMRHKIVTSLEWKCCPGFSGANCEVKAQPQKRLIHSSQAESHTAVGSGTMEGQQRQDCSDPEVVQKMADQMNQQALRLTHLQKQIDNVSLDVNDIKSTYSSLEEKINEDKDREFQSFLKGLKSKSINDFVKAVVREQLEIFQNDMQETVAQLFKTISRLSEDLENTRQSLGQVNESVVLITVQQKSVLKEESGSISATVLDLKNQVVNIKQEMVSRCEKPIEELRAKQTHLEGTLEQEHSQRLLYFESLNETLSEMKTVHEQLLPATQVTDRKNVPDAESIHSNATEYLWTLHETMKKQSLMMLSMLDDLHSQESKINNLTVALEVEKESVRRECEDMLSQCRSDFKFQIKGTEENVQVLNHTLAEVLFPMDNKMDRMNEQINDLTYDMEILQPLLEQGTSFKEIMAYEQPKEALATRKKVDNVIGAVNSLNTLVKELTKRHNLLRNEVQSRADTLDKRITEYSSEMEDGLNKTMTVMNSAIDFIHDNYVLKETLSTMQLNHEGHHKCPQNMETLLAFIAQFQRLNDSIQILVNDNQRYDFVLQVAKALAAIPRDKQMSLFSYPRMYQMVNETALQVKKCQKDVSHLEEKLLSDSKVSKNLDIRLQDIESKVSKVLIPYYVSLKKSSMSATERDHTLQLKVLNSRFKALEAKSIHLSINFSLLNKTLLDTSAMCQNAATGISELNATIPRRIKSSLPDIQLLQKGLTEYVTFVVEMKTQTVISNLTEYINQSLSSSLVDVFKSQKLVKPLMKKANIKKPTVNVTTIIVGRTQRNTDNIPLHEEHSDCSGSPCQNGGTCINGRNSFVCACRHPFTGDNCTVKLVEENALAPDFSKGSYRYAPMVAFFTSHTYGMTTPGPILFNNLDVNYGASYTPRTGKFRVPYLGVYIFKYTIESFSTHVSGFLVVDGVDKLAFESEDINGEKRCDRVLTGDALLELNYGQEVWLRLVKGTIPARFPPATTFSGYLLYRT